MIFSDVLSTLAQFENVLLLKMKGFRCLIVSSPVDGIKCITQEKAKKHVSKNSKSIPSIAKVTPSIDVFFPT